MSLWQISNSCFAAVVIALSTTTAAWAQTDDHASGVFTDSWHQAEATTSNYLQTLSRQSAQAARQIGASHPTHMLHQASQTSKIYLSKFIANVGSNIDL